MFGYKRTSALYACTRQVILQYRFIVETPKPSAFLQV